MVRDLNSHLKKVVIQFLIKMNHLNYVGSGMVRTAQAKSVIKKNFPIVSDPPVVQFNTFLKVITCYS